jgi:hypothetical protein
MLFLYHYSVLVRLQTPYLEAAEKFLLLLINLTQKAVFSDLSAKLGEESI